MATPVNASARIRAHDNYTPNSALRADADAYASAVACVFARPHAGYFACDAAKRRLIAMLCARLNLGPADADALERWSPRRLVEHYAPDLPDGYLSALKQADGVWPHSTYVRLEALLREGGHVVKTVQHVPLTPAKVLVLDALPPELRRVRIANLCFAPYYAELITRAVRQAWGRSPSAADMRTLAQRLERASTLQGVFIWLVEQVGVGRLTPPPIQGTDWLRPILDVRDIERTALKFQNCLRTRTPLMLRGQAAYFEVLGDEPAVVEVVNAAGYWKVGEIRGHANDAISNGLKSKIVTYLRSQGASIHRETARLGIELAEAAGW